MNESQDGRWYDADGIGTNPSRLEESLRSWPEDFAHENGRYRNICYRCRESFIGHKRRVVCRECVDGSKDPWNRWPDRHPEESGQYLCYIDATQYSPFVLWYFQIVDEVWNDAEGKRTVPLYWQRLIDPPGHGNVTT